MAKEWKSEPFSPQTDSLAAGSFNYLMDNDNLYITWYGGPRPSMAGIKGNITFINFSGHPEIYKRLLDPDPQNKGRIVLTGITRNQTNDIVLIYERDRNIITIGGGTPFTTGMRFGVDLVIPIKKPEKVLTAQIRHMLEPNPRTGLVGAYQDNEADFTARINALEFLKTNWFPGGSQLTAMDNIYFVAYAIQDIFPYIYQNWNSLDPLDIFYLFHNDDLIADGQDLLIWDGKPQDFITIYNGMREDLKKPQTHQLFTGWDKEVFILGDDNFSLENTTMGIVWDGKLMSITVEDGLKELDPQELINLFDMPPTRMAILRII